MTLVVARIVDDQVSMVADTQIVQQDSPNSRSQGVVKTCLLPNGICVGFAGSPELAERDIHAFAMQYRTLPSSEVAVRYFEQSSKLTRNEYLIAFSYPPMVIRIRCGKAESNDANTLWIGDKTGYEKFRKVELEKQTTPYRERAISSLLMADCHPNSSAGRLYSLMKFVVTDPSVQNVGHFISVVCSNESGFYYPAFSDYLNDLPPDSSTEFEFNWHDRIHLGSTGENLHATVAMFSTAYLNLNVFGYYYLTARLAYLFHPGDSVLATNCKVIRDVGPEELPTALSSAIGVSLAWKILVLGPPPSCSVTYWRNEEKLVDSGASEDVFCYCNTFPKSGESESLPVLIAEFAK